MKILHILHSFPPQGIGGTEHYVLQLAAAQQAAGHEVAVLYPLILPQGSRSRLIEDRYPLAGWTAKSSDPQSPPLTPPAVSPLASSSAEPPRSVRVYKVTNPNRNSLYWTAFNSEIEKHVQEAARRFNPDVIHIHHLYWLSVRIVEQLREVCPQAAQVFTLHDYWYACYKGTLRRPWGELCAGPDRLKCMGCIEADGFAPMAMRAFSRPGSLLFSAMRAGSAHVPQRWMERGAAGADSAEKRAMANAWFFLHREQEMLKALSGADAIISPSSYLASWYQGWAAKSGIHLDIRVIPHAVEHSRIKEAREALSQSAHAQPSSRPFTFGYIGQLAPHKGADHLLRGFRLAVLELMDRKENALPQVRLHGPAPLPKYLRTLHELASIPQPLLVNRIFFDGSFEARELSRVLSGIDVLVLPSRWPENAPLAVLEAMSAGIPVIAPRLGGIPELLDPENDGKHVVGASNASAACKVKAGWLYGHRDKLPSDGELALALIAAYKGSVDSVDSKGSGDPSGNLRGERHSGETAGMHNLRYVQTTPDMIEHSALVERVYKSAKRAVSH